MPQYLNMPFISVALITGATVSLSSVAHAKIMNITPELTACALSPDGCMPIPPQLPTPPTPPNFTGNPPPPPPPPPPGPGAGGGDLPPTVFNPTNSFTGGGAGGTGGTGGAGGGGLGGLSPAAGGNLGDLSPSAGGNMLDGTSGSGAFPDGLITCLNHQFTYEWDNASVSFEKCAGGGTGGGV